MVRNWFYYGLILLISLIFVYFYGERIAYITLYTVLLLPPVSGLTGFVSKFFFKFTQSINSDFVLKGDDIIYTLSLNNNSLFSYSHIKVVFYDDPNGINRIKTDIETKFFQLSAKQNKNIKFNIKCLYRGIIEIGADYIEFMDMLGLFKFKFPVGQKIKVLVYPRIVEINNFPVSFMRLSKTLSNLEMAEEDYTTVTDIRKYQDSDNYKKIHWKLSAKKDELLVKNFQSSVVNNTVLFLDLLSVTLDIEDKLIESVISITDYCLKKRIPVELHYFTDKHEVFTERSASGFFNIYSVCATVGFAGTGSLYDLLNEYALKQTDYTNIIIFTANINKALAGKIININNFGHSIVLFYISDKKEAGMLDDLRNSGVLCFEGSPQSFSL